MALTLLRHTRPAVAPGTCYGMTDLALPESFAADADALIPALPEVPVILTSPLGRCRALAERIAAARGVPVQVVDGWREMDFGAWEGRPWGAIARSEIDGWADDFHGYRGHGGESVAQLETRIRAALAETPEGALVVTHAGCIKAVCAIRGLRDGWQTAPEFGEAVPLDHP